MEKSVAVKRYARLGWKFREAQPANYLRVNTLRTPASGQSVVDILKAKGVRLAKVPFLPDGFEIKSARFSLGSTIEYLKGFYYLQGAAAQLPVELLDVRQGQLVLDCCASPGGKTTQIAAKMDNTGCIVAFEKKQERLSRLANNLERMGVKNAIAYHKDARKVDELGIKFDRVLLDAPCSGNFTQERGWFKKRSVKNFEEMGQLQKEILKSALKTLKPDGILVYSTCSLEPEENELVIDYAIKHLGVELVPIEVGIGVAGLTSVFDNALSGELRHARRIWPASTEGFFVAVLRMRP